MTDILCRWLNTDVKLSKKIEPTTFTAEFSSGFLLGELLYKYGLQDDFGQFSQNKSSEAKLNNFTRIEPVLRLLDIQFDTNAARSIMNENQSATTRLVYELFIALCKKQKKQLTGVAMETMRPQAPAKLDSMSSSMYKERLKHITPRQTDLNMDALVTRFHHKQQEMERLAFKDQLEEEDRLQRQIQEQRMKLIQKFREQQHKNTETLAKIQAATVHIAKPPPNKTAKAIAQRRQQRNEQQAKDTQQEIAVFETKLRRNVETNTTSNNSEPAAMLDYGEESLVYDESDLCNPSFTDEYINKVRKRLNEDANARAEREKRRRKVLIEQLMSNEAQEEAHREEVLVNLCMRQSIQERRIAVQLMQVRREKDVIRNNRLLKEKQFEESRQQEFKETLDKEADLCHLYKVQHQEQIEKDHQLHHCLMAERALAKYTKHYNMCAEVVSDIVDFAAKIGEYFELTNRLVPAKLFRDWTELFISGQPLFDSSDVLTETGIYTEEQMLADHRNQVLADSDFHEYRTMIGEWSLPVVGPVPTNPVLGHVIQRLANIFNPPMPCAVAPYFPPCPIKACIIGKTFSGKSSICEALAAGHRLEVLKIETLVAEAIEAYRTREMLNDESFSELNVCASDSSDLNKPKPNFTPSLGEWTLPTPVTSSAALPAVQRPNIESSTDQTAASSSGQPSNVNIQQETIAEGGEKSDPEKPVPSQELEQVSEESLIQLSERARLGRDCLQWLMSGKAVADELLVEIIATNIRTLPEGTGWILDGFPATLKQAILLEKVLSGYDAVAMGNELLEPASDASTSKKFSKSSLVPDPRPPQPPPPPVSGLNVVILVDLPDDVCLERAVQSDEGQRVPCTVSKTSSSVQQSTSKESDKDLDISIPEIRSLLCRDTSNDKDQMQQRLASFLDEWPHLEHWYKKFDILTCVDATAPQDDVIMEVEKIIEHLVNSLQGAGEPDYEFTAEELASPKLPPEPEPLPAEPPAMTLPTDPQSPSKDPVRATSRTGSRAGSKQDVRQGDKKKKDDKKKPTSPKRTDKKGKKELEVEQPPEPTGPPPPQPGSEEWEFVDRPIDVDLASVLVEYWQKIEHTYIDGSKKVFHLLRVEREQVIRYLYDVRRDFITFINRPDHKQQFISQWQKDYNCVSDDLRSDSEVRADLHQRVDDLRDRLWSISDERKEQAENERSSIMGNGWLDDHLGILDNHYITLMQVEVDCFQDTVQVLKDYYTGMEGRIPEEINTEYLCLPLLELPSTTGPDSCSALSTSVSPEPSEVDSRQNSKVSLAARKRKSVTQALDNTDLTSVSLDEKKTRIPLIPRRAGSPDVGSKSKLDKTKPVKGSQKDMTADESLVTPDVDEKLLLEANVTACASVDKIVSAEMAAREAELEAERLKVAAEEAAKKKGDKNKGGKPPAGKPRASSPKKGGKDKEIAPTPMPEESEEEKQRKFEEEKAKLDKERAKQEYMAAVNETAVATKIRLELIKAVALMVIQELKGKAESAYSEMNNWLGAEFLREMEGIDQLCQIMRYAIESGTKITEELRIQHTEFQVNQDVRLLRTPSPAPLPEPAEESLPDTFNLKQLARLFEQFSRMQHKVGPQTTDNQFTECNSSIMPLKAFQEAMQNLTTLCNASDWLPQTWISAPINKLEQVCQQLSCDGENIDWRRFLLHAAHPWPLPTQSDLLDALCKMCEMDQKNTGYISREQFELVDIWFKSVCGDDNTQQPSIVSSETVLPSVSDETQSCPQVAQEPSSAELQTAATSQSCVPEPSSTVLQTELRAVSAFDRVAHLRTVLFHIFADNSVFPPVLDYVNLLIYFSAASDSYDGFLRALSVVTATHMPRLPVKLHSKKTHSSENASIMEEHHPVWHYDIPQSACDAVVPIDALHRVLNHGQSVLADNYRFSSTSLQQENVFSKERLIGVYQELGSNDLQPIYLSVLLDHPVIQDVLSLCNVHKAVDLRAIMSPPDSQHPTVLTDP